MSAEIIEHESPVDNPWLYLDARRRYVASVRRSEWQKWEGGAGFRTVEAVSAESDNLAALEAWVRDRMPTERHWGAVHETWPMNYPAGHRLHGKRDNRQLWARRGPANA